ncbi:MAG TPA: alpha/beta fold hydrolase [Syntrophorhabdaceae bacterium]|nr:alpha/beta fold hydrolase [Syntrophorhabdaceae bacterium]
MTFTEPFELASVSNKISGLMVFPEGTGKFRCVILSHGLISSKESSKYVALSERFAEAGVATCRFDYHGCGESGGKIGQTTLTIRLDNLSRVADYVLHHNKINPEKIGIIGSSFGATSALIKAARDARIRCVSLWATPYLLEKEGDGSIDGIPFQDDIYTDFARYDVLEEARKVSRALVIHGEVDETVPCAEGQRIYENLREPKGIEIVKGGDHVFSNPAHRDRVINLALDWFDTYLPA